MTYRNDEYPCDFHFTIVSSLYELLQVSLPLNISSHIHFKFTANL